MRQKQSIFSLFLLSPSSRRAWIEIHTAQHTAQGAPVALLAEGVDRNIFAFVLILIVTASPSSRRAWIEITNDFRGQNSFCGRPPRGGRG